MKKIIIYGANGSAKEVAHLIEDINFSNIEKWKIIGFVDDFRSDYGVNINGYPLVKFEEELTKHEKVSVVIAIANSSAKRKILNKLKRYSQIDFPNLVHPKIRISNTNKIGFGNIICEGAILTTNIEVGNFVSIGVNSTIGHDTIVKDFTTILPSSSVSGNIIIEEGVFVGTNSTIIEKLSIGESTIIGAGAVVIRNLPANCTAVGNPAKIIKFNP